MTVILRNPREIALSGSCGSDDAEALLEHLVACPGANIDWSACEGAHTAVVQLILAAGRAVKGPPKDDFLLRWVEPLLVRG